MAVFYHGTTGKQARPTDRLHGFEPRAPSRRVWFARNRAVAERRARRKSHAGERSLVLRCEIDIGALARNAESGHIFHSRGVQRLAQWIQRRIAQDPDGHISGSEVAQVASRWRWR